RSGSPPRLTAHERERRRDRLEDAADRARRLLPQMPHARSRRDPETQWRRRTLGSRGQGLPHWTSTTRTIEVTATGTARKVTSGASVGLTRRMAHSARGGASDVTDLAPAPGVLPGRPCALTLRPWWSSSSSPLVAAPRWAISGDLRRPRRPPRAAARAAAAA